jgi:predicted membrane protein
MYFVFIALNLAVAFLLAYFICLLNKETTMESNGKVDIQNSNGSGFVRRKFIGDGKKLAVIGGIPRIGHH